MDNPKYIQVMRQVASDFDGISHELFQVASDLERMDQYNPQQKLFSLVRSAEVSSVTLRNLTARTVRNDTAPFYCVNVILFRYITIRNIRKFHIPYRFFNNL